MYKKNTILPEYPTYKIHQGKMVTVKFICKKCGKPFLKSVDEDQYKYVLKDPFFLKSKTCSKCVLKGITGVFKASKKKFT